MNNIFAQNNTMLKKNILNIHRTNVKEILSNYNNFELKFFLYKYDSMRNLFATIFLICCANEIVFMRKESMDET